MSQVGTTGTLTPLISELNERVHVFTGGQLKLSFHVWKKHTSDSTVLEVIKGYKLKRSDEPPLQLRKPFPFRLSSSEVTSIDNEIQSLWQKRVIEASHTQAGEFYSNIFTRVKTWRIENYNGLTIVK